MQTSTTRPVHDGGEQRRTINIGNLGALVMLPTAGMNGAISLVEHTLAPGALGAPPHLHTREDETSYVLQGVLTAQLGDRIVTAGPGEAVVKPRGEFHTFWNAGDEPLRFLEVITPGGFEEYFAELAPLIPAAGPPDMGAIIALGARYGLEFDLAAVPALMERHGVRLG